MMKIFKYEIPIEDYFELELPKGAHILDVQIQYGSPKIWALVDSDAETEKRCFTAIGTGNPITRTNLIYWGTFQSVKGNFVWHLFEIKEGISYMEKF